jgi:L-lysine exporter family protein LysE/ArgO
MTAGTMFLNYIFIINTLLMEKLMLKYLIQGLLFGLAYVAPIGAQNLYVINTAIKENRKTALQVALITVFFDISLAVSCFFGIGILVERFHLVKGTILLLGSILVTYIGIGLIRSSSQITYDVSAKKATLTKIIAACFAVTWLNPQAIIDGSLLLGGFRASLPPEMSKFFILGVCAASFLWFHFLAFISSKLSSRLGRFIQWINRICGFILILYGLNLGYSFIQFLLRR